MSRLTPMERVTKALQALGYSGRLVVIIGILAGVVVGILISRKLGL